MSQEVINNKKRASEADALLTVFYHSKVSKLIKTCIRANKNNTRDRLNQFNVWQLSIPEFV